MDWNSICIASKPIGLGTRHLIFLPHATSETPSTTLGKWKGHPKSKKTSLMKQSRSQQTFYLKRWVSKYARLVRYMVSFCNCSALPLLGKGSHRLTCNEWVWLCPNKTLFIRTVTRFSSGAIVCRLSFKIPKTAFMFLLSVQYSLHLLLSLPLSHCYTASQGMDQQSSFCKAV